MDHSICVRVYEKGGLDVLDLRDTYFQIPIHPESQQYLRFVSRGVSTSYVPCVLVCPQPAGVLQSLRSGSGVGAPEGCSPSSLPGRLADHSGVEDPSAAALGSGFPVV